MPTAVNRKNALDTQLVFCATGEVSYHNINLQTVCNSWNSNTAFCYAYFKQEIRNVSSFFAVYHQIFITKIWENKLVKSESMWSKLSKHQLFLQFFHSFFLRLPTLDKGNTKCFPFFCNKSSICIVHTFHLLWQTVNSNLCCRKIY